MQSGSQEKELSIISEAYGLKLGNDLEAALRVAIAALENSTTHLDAALLSVSLLIEGHKPLLAGEVAARLVEAYCRRGDLPLASTAAMMAVRSGDDGHRLRTRIAQLFGAESSLVDEHVAPTPPPLPKPIELQMDLPGLTGKPLFDRAERTLRTFLTEDDPLPTGRPVPKYPVFGDLPTMALEQLLGALTLVEKNTGEVIFHQGDPGHEAFLLARGRVVPSVRREGQLHHLASHGPGILFGELALVTAGSRPNTVAAQEPTMLLSIKKEHVDILAEAAPDLATQLSRYCRRRMLEHVISNGVIFSHLDQQTALSLVAQFRIRSFQEGEVIVQQGDNTGSLVMLAAGSASAVREDGKERLGLGTVYPGDITGEMSVVMSQPAVATVTANELTVGLELPRNAFLAVMKKHRSVFERLKEIAIKRQRSMRQAADKKALPVDESFFV